MMRLIVTAFVIMLSSGCTIEDQNAPPLSGPSGLGRYLKITAAPDTLQRDGSSQSQISLIYTDHENKPLRRRILLAASSGTLSVPEVTTNDAGEAKFVLTAPDFNTPASRVDIVATPVADAADVADGANAVSQVIEINLVGPAFPSPSFAFAPAAPAQFELVTFDASATSLSGSSCGGCTYHWNFGDGETGTGRVIDHRFEVQGSLVVTLTVVSPSGTTSSTTRTVSVGIPIAPTARFSFSPSNPKIGDTVFFDAAASTGANGATIVQYRWNFGNGTILTTASSTTSTSYGSERSFTVQLTIVDSNGQTATLEQGITVAP
jgi:hypothetical protein